MKHFNSCQTLRTIYFMKKHFSMVFLIFFIISCKINPDSNRNYASKNKIYKIQLTPAIGSKYYYEITNQSKLELEVDGKKVSNLNKTNLGVNYGIIKDSSGNILLTTSYDKIHIYSKNGDNETDIDADNA